MNFDRLLAGIHHFFGGSMEHETIIYIYIWYPPLRSTSEHFDILSLHVYI